ncbi:MAG: hypothetical protein ACP5E5_15225 [Acidobacteriaceae bacterium]
MHIQEKSKFADLIRTINKPFGIHLDNADVDIWWVALHEFPFDAVEVAAMETLRTSRFAPKPADLYTRIVDRLKGLWFSPEEAWAHAIKAADESETIVWTTEAARAYEDVKHLVDKKDLVAARSAFLKAYQRYVEDAVEERRSPAFVISLGYDKERRRAAICRARAKKYISEEHANRYLAELGSEITEEGAMIAGFITGKVVPHPSANAQKLAAMMRAALDKAQAEEKAEMEARQAERERKRREMEDRRRRIIEQAESLVGHDSQVS